MLQRLSAVVTKLPRLPFQLEDRCFLVFGKENKQTKKREMLKHLCYYCFQSGREKDTQYYCQ